MTNQSLKPRYTPFVLLQFVSLTSIISGSMMFLIFPWLCIQITGQATSAGLMLTISNIPGLLVSPLVGSVIDKFGRRRVGFYSELLMALLGLAFPLIAHSLGTSFVLVIVAALLRALVGSGNGTARKALVPDTALVARMSLERANSIHESVFAAGFAIGPAVGAFGIQFLGAVDAFWISAGFGLVSALATLLIRVVEQQANLEGDEGRNFASYAVQGFKILAENPSVLLLMATIMSLALIYLPTELVLLPSYYNKLGDSNTLGFLLSIMAAFTTIGSLLFEQLAKRFKFSSLLRFTILGVGLSMLPMSFLPPGWVMFGFGALLGVAWGPLGPLLNTVIQRKIPANVRGRVFSLEMSIWTGGPMISMTLAGLAVDAWGVRLVYPCIAVAVLLAGVVISTRKSIDELNVD